MLGIWGIRDMGLGSPTRRALSPRQLTLQIACEPVINYSKTGHSSQGQNGQGQADS